MTASAASVNKESLTAGRCEGISTRALAVTRWEHFQRRFFFFIVVLNCSAFGDKRRGGEKEKEKSMSARASIKSGHDRCCNGFHSHDGLQLKCVCVRMHS